MTENCYAGPEKYRAIEYCAIEERYSDDIKGIYSIIEKQAEKGLNYTYSLEIDSGEVRDAMKRYFKHKGFTVLDDACRSRSIIVKW